jgi:predicted nucleotidyltransferase
MIPTTHINFANRAVETLKDNPQILGVAAGGSWISGEMDEFSDIDLVIVVDASHEQEISNKRFQIAEKLGTLLSAFTGEHVGEPRLVICLYDSPLLHVDLKFVSIMDFAKRVENPVILWERNGELSRILANSDGVFPTPDFQWIEDRFWVWVHYTASKLGRGELFEAIEGLSFLRVTVLGPLALMKNGRLPRGMRYIERDAPEELESLKKTISGYNLAECAAALKSAIDLYRELRKHHASPTLLMRSEAEKASLKYLTQIAHTL